MVQEQEKKLLLIDGNSVAFRAFFALYRQVENFVNQDGLHTSAIYAFKNMLDVIMKREKPTNVLVAFDAGKTTFRTKMYGEYKGTRSKTPNELMEQLPYLREMLTYLGLKSYELKDYEADDIIGTLAKKAEEEGLPVVIITGDRDLTQLSTENVRVDVTIKGANEIEQYTPAHVQEKMGVTPRQIIDIKALVGDTSDNYPGVTKVGKVTAEKLIKEYGSVEGIYENIAEMKANKLKENLINDREQAFMSKDLATIRQDAPIEIGLLDTVISKQETQNLRTFYQRMNFNSFLTKLANEATDELTLQLGDDELKSSSPTELEYSILRKEENFANFANFAAALQDLKSSTDVPEVTFILEMLGENYHTADFVAFGFMIGKQIFVSDDVALLNEPLFTELLTDKKVQKNVFDLKRTIVALNRIGIPLVSADFDMLLASYLINNEINSNDVATVAMAYDFTAIQTDDDVYGKGVKTSVPTELSELFGHIANKLNAISTLKPDLLNKLMEQEQDSLFDEMEIPLARVLAKMEIAGITVKAPTLTAMQNDLAIRLAEIEQKIYSEVGEKFNLNSPKQLGVILFDKLGLPPIKKTKTGYSTSVEVLEELKSQSPVVEMILDYRQINKIQSTYVTGLLKVIHDDGKIHTRYIQTLTATGRLSSVDPNLQNIPVRIDEGKQIRKAFVPSAPGWQIFASDYSQVELRVLAHVSQDQNMQQAFKNGIDIHANTAMRIFNLNSPEDVTPLMRRQAKAVNFGIVYGISDFGLAKNIGITRSQAKQFIEGYFDTYPQVHEFMQKSVKSARENGFVETIMHRRRYLPDIHSKNFNLRSFAERTAMNSPIQGGAADIIKIAMINMEKKLREQNLKTRMLLQVHDELIFEVPDDELEIIKKLVPSVMDAAVKLDVPLLVEYGFGPTWYDVK